jgi:phosphate starvation-inducible PhoH-like protein
MPRSRKKAITAEPTQNPNIANKPSKYTPSGKKGQLKQSITIIPRNERQEELLEYLMDEERKLVCTIGSSGCGKSYLCMASAIKALEEKKIRKIVITRPYSAVDGISIGALPGTMFEKMEPFLLPLLDFLEDFYSKKDVAQMIETGIVAIEPLMYLRGRNLNDAWIVADEMQNSSINECKTLLTRLGETSRVFITGDLKQADRKFENDNGLKDLITRLGKYESPLTAMVQFNKEDSVRSPLVRHILKLYEEE